MNGGRADRQMGGKKEANGWTSRRAEKGRRKEDMADEWWIGQTGCRLGFTDGWTDEGVGKGFKRCPHLTPHFTFSCPDYLPHYRASLQGAWEYSRAHFGGGIHSLVPRIFYRIEACHLVERKNDPVVRATLVEDDDPKPQRSRRQPSSPMLRFLNLWT